MSSPLALSTNNKFNTFNEPSGPAKFYQDTTLIIQEVHYKLTMQLRGPFMRLTLFMSVSIILKYCLTCTGLALVT